MAKKKNTVRKDGRIAVQVYIGRDAEGRRKYKTVYGHTQKEADEKALQLKLAMKKGIDISAERDTFGDWAARWIKIKAVEVSDNWLDVYRSVVNHINGHIEHAELCRIRAVDLQGIINDLTVCNPNTGKPASRRFLEVVKTTLSQIFELAIENRVMEYNPARGLKLPKIVSEETRRALTANEQLWIVGTEHRARRAAMIMMYSGLRRGELIPLTWADVDLINKTISVNKTVKKEGNQFSVKSTGKTVASIRTVDIPQKLVDYLRAEAKDSILLCPDAKGGLHTPSSWRRMWDSYLFDLNVKCGDFTAFQRIGKNGEVREIKSKYDPEGVPFVIPKITPHWLRHTFATMLYLAGVDVLTAKEQLGHTDIKTTLGIYTHLDATHKRKSMNKLDEYLKDAIVHEDERICYD